MSLILSLGQMPLANALRSDRDLAHPEETYPLDLVLCLDCALVQITETVAPEKLFREYAYFSSFSDTMLCHAERIALRLIDERRLGTGSLVAEVASNDGYLLQYYRRAGIPVLGIEPAVNIARVAEERGVRTLSQFFGERLAADLREKGERADVVHANNVLGHVPDLPGFVRGLALMVKDHGVVVIEVPYVKDLVARCEFDTIYHEHLSYFSLTAVQRLFERCSLSLVDVERIPIHGGSLRIFGAQRNQHALVSSRVEALLAEEREWGIDRSEAYQDFARRVQSLKRSLVELVAGLKREGKRLAAYGAAAKGSTLLSYCGVGDGDLEFVADRSTYKQGHYMPGTRLPIVPPSRLLEAMPDYVLLLTWNFADEILEQQAEYRRRGGRFIIPIPEVRVV